MKRLVFAFLLLSMLCACATVDAHRNNKRLMELSPGMSRDEVVHIMGTPQHSEVFNCSDGQEITFLFYETREPGTVITTSALDRCTPVVLVDGMLRGWGEGARRNALRLSLEQ